MIDLGFIGSAEVYEKRKRKIAYFSFLNTPFCTSFHLLLCVCLGWRDRNTEKEGSEEGGEGTECGRGQALKRRGGHVTDLSFPLRVIESCTRMFSAAQVPLAKPGSTPGDRVTG